MSCKPPRPWASLVRPERLTPLPQDVTRLHLRFHCSRSSLGLEPQPACGPRGQPGVTQLQGPRLQTAQCLSTCGPHIPRATWCHLVFVRVLGVVNTCVGSQVCVDTFIHKGPRDPAVERGRGGPMRTTDNENGDEAPGVEMPHTHVYYSAATVVASMVCTTCGHMYHTVASVHPL